MKVLVTFRGVAVELICDQ